MLLTDDGIGQLASWRHRIATRLSEFVLRKPTSVDESYQLAWNPGEIVVDSVRPAAMEPEMLRFRSQLHRSPDGTALAAHEQRARILALRGLSQARDGEYEQAQASFTSAVRLDPRLDLALLPSFWLLPRRAHEVAVEALRDANRARDAAALTATIRNRFRPRALRAINLANGPSGD
ncbi:MAG: hypothetical protein M9947_00845 [Thermomicrobiales bacterium]|nr:hypothetical protein [Thermomicrobiales bacterium]